MEQVQAQHQLPLRQARGARRRSVPFPHLEQVFLWTSMGRNGDRALPLDGTGVNIEAEPASVTLRIRRRSRGLRTTRIRARGQARTSGRPMMRGMPGTGTRKGTETGTGAGTGEGEGESPEDTGKFQVGMQIDMNTLVGMRSGIYPSHSPRATSSLLRAAASSSSASSPRSASRAFSLRAVRETSGISMLAGRSTSLGEL
ncbi:hypothetical protein B0H12DRAFT_476868 [Mycena haematopus]|nr:hypothetical protein B0H12DRAFT_476868 [Mycena haematopus]